MLRIQTFKTANEYKVRAIEAGAYIYKEELAIKILQINIQLGYKYNSFEIELRERPQSSQDINMLNNDTVLEEITSKDPITI